MKKISIVLVMILFSLPNNLNAQDMDSIDKRQEKIVTIAANTAVGNLEQLKKELNAGLDNGLTINEIKEVLVQMYAYCGFPRSLHGLNTFMAVVQKRQAGGINDTIGKDASPVIENENKYAKGKKVLEELTNRPENAPSGVNAFAPVIDQFLKEHLFADIFERDILTYKEREIATISALMAMKGVEPMLQSHLGMGMNTGLTEFQLKEIISVIGNSIGQEQAKTGLDILNKVLQSRK